MQASTETLSTIELIGARHAAMVLGVSATTFRKLNTEEKCPKPFKFGNAAKWWREEFMDWIDAGRPSRKDWEAAKKESGACKTNTKSHQPQPRQPANAVPVGIDPGTGRGGWCEAMGFAGSGQDGRRRSMATVNDAAAVADVDTTIVAPPDPALLVDANEAARMCSMHRASWYKTVSGGKAPAGIRIGGMVRWRRDEIEAWIAAGCPARAKWDVLWNPPATKIGKRA